MGLVYSRDRNWQDSERAFRRSIELNAGLSESRRDFGFSVLFPLGRLDEAVRELRKAVELDPLSAQVHDSLEYVLVSDGRYDEALDNCRRILLSHPNDNAAEQLSARALLQKGRLNEATAIFEKQDQAGTGSPGFLGYAYALAGRRADAKKVAAHYPDWPWAQVFVYAGLGDKDRTFKALEQMATNHDPRVGAYLTYPELALLRGDRRLTEFRQRQGMPSMPNLSLHNNSYRGNRSACCQKAIIRVGRRRVRPRSDNMPQWRAFHAQMEPSGNHGSARHAHPRLTP